MHILIIVCVLLFLLVIFSLYQIYLLRQLTPKQTLGADGKLRTEEGTSALGIGLVIVFILVFVAIAYFSLKATMTRYSMAENAMAQGNTGLAAVMLSPEIGAGIGDIIKDIKS